MAPEAATLICVRGLRAAVRNFGANRALKVSTTRMVLSGLGTSL
jgi:hypothetical protein